MPGAAIRASFALSPKRLFFSVQARPEVSSRVRPSTRRKHRPRGRTAPPHHRRIATEFPRRPEYPLFAPPEALKKDPSPADHRYCRCPNSPIKAGRGCLTKWQPRQIPNRMFVLNVKCLAMNLNRMHFSNDLSPILLLLHNPSQPHGHLPQRSPDFLYVLLTPHIGVESIQKGE